RRLDSLIWVLAEFDSHWTSSPAKCELSPYFLAWSKCENRSAFRPQIRCVAGHGSVSRKHDDSGARQRIRQNHGRSDGFLTHILEDSGFRVAGTSTSLYS